MTTTRGGGGRKRRARVGQEQVLRLDVSMDDMKLKQRLKGQYYNRDGEQYMYGPIWKISLLPMCLLKCRIELSESVFLAERKRVRIHHIPSKGFPTQKSSLIMANQSHEPNKSYARGWPNVDAVPCYRSITQVPRCSLTNKVIAHVPTIAILHDQEYIGGGLLIVIQLHYVGVLQVLQRNVTNMALEELSRFCSSS